MLNMGRLLIIMKLVVESADSEQALADSSTDSNIDPAKVGVWLRAFTEALGRVCSLSGQLVWTGLK